ncbi:hypothetical protein LCGC14_3115280, partial [marine sediment metagenome]
ELGPPDGALFQTEPKGQDLTHYVILLEAEESLLSAQNQLTAAVVNYRIAELQIQRDMGLLMVDSKGLWKEFSPETLNDK